MAIQSEVGSSTEARLAKPIAEERMVIRVMETKREDKAEMESGKEPKGSR